MPESRAGASSARLRPRHEPGLDDEVGDDAFVVSAALRERRRRGVADERRERRDDADAIATMRRAARGSP